jgi:hypothetical protein
LSLFIENQLTVLYNEVTNKVRSSINGSRTLNQVEGEGEQEEGGGGGEQEGSLEVKVKNSRVLNSLFIDEWLRGCVGQPEVEPPAGVDMLSRDE